MADMQALFAEMRKAQTGAATSPRSSPRAEPPGRPRERLRLLGRLLDASSDSESDAAMPPRGLSREDERALLRVSQVGRAASRARRAAAAADDDDARSLRAAAYPSLDPGVEAARLRAVSSLAAAFEASVGDVLGGRWWNHLEDWLFALRSAAAKKGSAAPGSSKRSSHDDRRYWIDPALPDPALAGRDPELRRKLLAAGLDERTARGAEMALERAARKAKAQFERESNQPPATAIAAPDVRRRRREKKNHARRAVAVERVDASAARGGASSGRAKIRLSYGTVRVEVNEAHFDKLRALFGRYGWRAARARRGGGKKIPPSSRDAASFSAAFHRAAFCLLARYHARRARTTGPARCRRRFPALFLTRFAFASGWRWSCARRR